MSQITTTGAADIVKQFQKMKKNALINFLGDENKRGAFLSAMTSDIERTPKLRSCSLDSLIDAYITIAELGFLPSKISGEAYVIPRWNKDVNGYSAHFQIGYQGLVTLLYRSGVKAIVSDIVRQNDHFHKSLATGISHEYSLTAPRGEAVAAYTVVTLENGEKVNSAMTKEEILEIGQRFSESYYESKWETDKKTGKKQRTVTENLSESSPWNPKNDPQLWMWKKTTLVQAYKLCPKNKLLTLAIEKDYQGDSVVEQHAEIIEENRLITSMQQADTLKMKSITKPAHDTTQETVETAEDLAKNEEPGSAPAGGETPQRKPEQPANNHAELQ